MEDSPTASLIRYALAGQDKTQAQIAREAGFSRPNVLSMIKNGEMRVPIERVPALARATGLDALVLLQVAMSEYMPDTWRAILSILSEANERSGPGALPNEPMSSAELGEAVFQNTSG